MLLLMLLAVALACCFWRSCIYVLAWAGHEHLDLVVPLFIHVDAGPITKRLSTYILQWGSILGYGSELEQCFIMATWIADGDRSNEVYDELEWSLSCLSAGRFPERDRHGVAFPEDSWRHTVANQLLAPACGDVGLGFSAAFIQLRGDLEWLCNGLGLNHFNSFNPCGLCGADREDIPWVHFSTRAKWLETIYTVDGFLERYATADSHKLFRVAGMTPQTISIDLLHVLDHNGLTSNILGNLFYEAIRDRELGNRSQAEGLDILNRRIKEFNSQANLPAHLPILTLQSLINTQAATTSFPCLQGRAIKAANTRHCVPFAVALAREMDDGRAHTMHRRRCLEELHAFYELVYNCPMFLTEAQSRKMQQHVFGCLHHYVWLAKASARVGICGWRIVPKAHYFFHVGLRSDFMNPRFGQTYINESLVGRICNIYKSSLTGPAHSNRRVQRSVLTKYLTGLALSLSMQ